MRSYRNVLARLGRARLGQGVLVILAAVLLFNGIGNMGGPAQAAGERRPQGPFTLYLPAVLNGQAEVNLSAQDLIAIALLAGEIDYPTSLLYRAYALYGDSRLPVDLRGGGSAEDSSLYPEIEAALPGLPAEMQASFHPFLVRPDHPDSAVQYLPPPPAELAAARAVETAAEFTCEPAPDGGPAWGTLSSSTIPVSVHAMCYTGPIDNVLTLPHLQQTLQILESLWGPVKEFMGVEPLSDLSALEDGGDGKIDFYLLHDGEIYSRGSSSLSVRGLNVQGATRPLLPRSGKAAAGYVVLRRALLEQGGDPLLFKQATAHELFHLFQFARNQEMLFRDRSVYWFSEASAEWASWNFVPEGRARVHGSRYAMFQNSTLALHASNTQGMAGQMHAYAAYIWPFFMHQEVNSYAISLAWRDMAGVSTWEAADQVLDDWVSFDENFPNFALRNLNNKARFGAAYSGHYVDFDPTFPDGKMSPRLAADRRVLAGESYSELAALPALGARYYHYIVDPDVMQVEVDVSDFQPADHFKANMVAKIKGQGWKLIPISGSSPVKFCQDQPDEEVEEFYLVLSNSDMPVDQELRGVFTVRDLVKPCACQDFTEITAFTGTITFSYHQTGEDADDRVSADHFGQFSFTMPKVSQNEGGVSYIGPLQGVASINDSHTYKSEHPWTTTLVGQGPPINSENVAERSHAYLLFNLAECTYNFGAVPYILAANESFTSDTNVGALRSGDRPVPFPIAPLEGDTTFPAHSEDWGLQVYGDAYFPGGYGAALFDDAHVPEDAGGLVPLAWTLTPVFGP